MYIKQFTKITLTFDFQRLIQKLVLKNKKTSGKKSVFEKLSAYWYKQFYVGGL